jgi:hypothetical protein
MPSAAAPSSSCASPWNRSGNTGIGKTKWHAEHQSIREAPCPSLMLCVIILSTDPVDIINDKDAEADSRLCVLVGYSRGHSIEINGAGTPLTPLTPCEAKSVHQPPVPVRLRVHSQSCRARDTLITVSGSVPMRTRMKR